MKRKLPKPSKIANCTVCGHSAGILYFLAACHPQAPLRLDYQTTGTGQGVLAACCYDPECRQAVGTFEVSAVLYPLQAETTGGARQPNDCDLCGDNDPQHFHTTPVDSLTRFTAPFRLEHHRPTSEPSTLHVFCPRQGCGRLFAVLAMDTGPKN